MTSGPGERPPVVPDPETAALLRRLGHDVRTPLNNIVGALELIELQAHKPAEVAKWAGVARTAADHLRDLLDEFSRTTRG